MSTTSNEGFPAQPGEAPLEETLDAEVENVDEPTEPETPEVVEVEDSEPVEEPVVDDGPKLITPKSKSSK